MLRIDKNYIFQGVALLIPFLLSPLVFNIYGADSFGRYSVIVAWATYVSFFMTLRSEALIVGADNVKDMLNVSLTIWLYISVVVISTFWVFMTIVPDLDLIVYVATSLSVFTILNYYMIVTHRYAYTVTQLIKILVFYIVLFVGPHKNVGGMVFSLVVSFLVSVLAAKLLSNIALKSLNIQMTSYVLSIPKRSFPFLISSALEVSRELILVSFMMYKYGADNVGTYFLASMYMVKGFVAYSTIQSNKIKYGFQNEASMQACFFNIVKHGVVVFCSVLCVLLTITYSDVEFFIDVLFMYSLLPVTFMFVFFMPFTAIYEALVLGRLNALFNFLSTGILVLLCVACYIFDFEILMFIFAASLLWLFVVIIQVVLGVVMYKKKGAEGESQ